MPDHCPTIARPSSEHRPKPNRYTQNPSSKRFRVTRISAFRRQKSCVFGPSASKTGAKPPFWGQQIWMSLLFCHVSKTVANKFDDCYAFWRQNLSVCMCCWTLHLCTRCVLQAFRRYGERTGRSFLTLKLRNHVFVMVLKPNACDVVQIMTKIRGHVTHANKR